MRGHFYAQLFHTGTDGLHRHKLGSDGVVPFDGRLGRVRMDAQAKACTLQPIRNATGFRMMTGSGYSGGTPCGVIWLREGEGWRVATREEVTPQDF